MTSRILLFLSCVFLISSPVLSNKYIFDHISTADGLPNNRIRDIIQDQSGYMWIATSKGVSRYDGHSFQNYPDEYAASLSLGAFRLRRMFEDNTGAIWSTSLSGKCYRIDPVNQNIINLQDENLLPPESSVRRYLISSSGDVWLLLRHGVARMYYNSDGTKTLQSQYFDSTILGTEQVNFIYEDQSEMVWLGTDHGLISMSFNSEEKENYDMRKYFMTQNISFHTVDECKGKLYFGVDRSQIIIYDSAKGAFDRKFELSDDFTGHITQIASNDFDFLLMGATDGKVIYYNAQTEDYKIISIPHIGDANISDIFADSFGFFWIVTENRGVYQFSPKTLAIIYFDLDSQNRSFLGEMDKQLLLEDSNRELWIGINGGGLFHFDRETNSFVHYRHQPNNSGSISSDIILSLYEDRSKNLWIGTSYGGLNKVSLKKEKLLRVFPESAPQTGFDNYIRSTTSDILDNTWLGTKAGKIYVYNQNKEKIATLPDDLHPSKRFPLANIYTLYFDNDNNLWIGTKGYGIFVIKSPLKHIDNLGNQDLKVVHFKHNVEDTNSISSDNVYSIKQDVYGQFWIGSFLSGIDLLNNPFSNPTFEAFSGVNGNTEGLPSDEIRDLIFDRNNNLWIATSNGVSVLESQYLNAEKKKFIHTTANTNNSSIPEEVVYQIKQVSNGDMLFAMLDGGVHRLAYSDYLKQNYTWKQCSGELAISSIYSIEQDSEGNIWMGADNGLFRYNSDYEMIDRFQLKNNHLPLSFSENCSCSKLSQEIMFGSTNGLIVLHPDSMRRDPNQYPLLFSKLEVNGSIVSSQNSNILDVPIAWQNKIALSYNQNNITLFFSVLDFENPQLIQYKSFLEGYDSYWSAPSSSNSVSYRKLPPGKYTLRVKGTNGSGVWIDETAKIDIVITPLFRNSLLGRTLLYLLVFIMVSVVLIVTYRQVKIQNKVRVEKAITEKRIEYYTNLSHEFKTPLSLILGPVEEIISSQKSSVFAQQKGLQIKKNAIYIKRLIDQILDFRKMREGKMKLSVSEVNIIEFFREIYLVFLPLSKKMGVQFDFEYDEDKYLGFADTSHIEKIVYNLLSNAFRFSSEGKRVRLMVSIDPTKKQLHFSVVDQGPGISQEEIGKIFQRFYDSKHSSGIGLFYTQELVSLHKGEISVKNNTDEGAHFQVSIPLAKKTYGDNEITNKKVGLAFDLRDISDIETIVSQDDMPEIEHKHLVDYFETILVVEDNVEMRNYLRNSLSDKHKVLVAKDGLEGLEIAQSQQPTLILSDVAMPVMDGYEMVRRLKSNFDTSHIPIFLVTAESSEEQKMFAMECGVDDFISKPFSLSFLLARVEHIITQRKRLKERFERDNESENEIIVDTSVTKSNFLTQVQELVIDNMSNEQMNVEFLVEKMGSSRTLFYKKMRSFSGYAPNEYIRIVRMKEAARLLTTSDITINEISSLVGISDSNYFSKMFKKHFGESPSSYKYNN